MINGIKEIDGVLYAQLRWRRQNDEPAAVRLSGCASRLEPQIQYVRVEVPVQIPCRAPKVAVPPWAAAGLRKTDSLEVKVRALLAERRQRIGYERQLAAAASACK